MRNRRILATVALLPFLFSRSARAYSVLTHEAIIDTAWEDRIKPLLLQRFPNTTPEELVKAHSFAYGGGIIADAGYYPFGSKFFSDLLHYVRSGDFVLALLTDSQDVNEYAFALGSLAHYAADNNGHRIAVNRVVPMLYPKLRARFGPVVTYEDDPAAHLKTEFGFDVVQIANNKYAPQAYHDFIGFEIAKPLLERAVVEVYDLKLDDVFAHDELALGTFRYSVSKLIPLATNAAWAAKKNEIRALMPGITKRKFIYNLSRASFRKEWGTDYHRPGWGARLVAFLFRILPKVGPFKAFAFKVPGPEGEKLFMSSFNTTMDRYRELLAEVGKHELTLPDTNLDTGDRPQEGTYRRADQAYANLLDHLAERHVVADPALRANILKYFDRPNIDLPAKTRQALEDLRAATK